MLFICRRLSLAGAFVSFPVNQTEAFRQTSHQRGLAIHRKTIREAFSFVAVRVSDKASLSKIPLQSLLSLVTSFLFFSLRLFASRKPSRLLLRSLLERSRDHKIRWQIQGWRYWFVVFEHFVSYFVHGVYTGTSWMEVFQVRSGYHK